VYARNIGLYTHRHVSAGTPAHDPPPSAVPRCPLRQSLQLAHVSVPPHAPSPHDGPHAGQVDQAPYAPHVHVVASQLRVRCCVVPQPPGHAAVSALVSPGLHVALVVHEPGSHALHVQVASQRRVALRVPSPHAPHVSVRDSSVPARHAPSSSQSHAPQAQSDPHTRRSRPQWPQPPPSSSAAGAHAPAPAHAPSSTHRPSSHVWRCEPQLPQSIVRGDVPVAQSHARGAEHSPHQPSMQRLTPDPHSVMHAASCVEPTDGSRSLQSVRAGTPSESPSISSQRSPLHAPVSLRSLASSRDEASVEAAAPSARAFTSRAGSAGPPVAQLLATITHQHDAIRTELDCMVRRPSNRRAA